MRRDLTRLEPGLRILYYFNVRGLFHERLRAQFLATTNWQVMVELQRLREIESAIVLGWGYGRELLAEVLVSDFGGM